MTAQIGEAQTVDEADIGERDLCDRVGRSRRGPRLCSGLRIRCRLEPRRLGRLRRARFRRRYCLGCCLQGKEDGE